MTSDRPYTITGRFTLLRPPEPGDYGWLYRLSHQRGTHGRYRSRGQVVRPEAFGDALWNDVLTQFVVDSKRDGKPLGLVSFYGFDSRNGTCFMAVLAEEDARMTGWAAEGFVLALDFVIRNWPVRKIYADVIEGNLGQFESATTSLFVREGVLRAHELVDGDHVDVHVLACHSETFLSALGKLSHLLESRSQ